MKFIYCETSYKSSFDQASFQGVGSASATEHAAIQVPYAALQARIAAGTARPPVETPATPPAAATHAPHTTLQPV